MNSFRNGFVKIPFPDLEDLFNKSLHWILGGICINILNWSDIQLPLCNTHYYINGSYNMTYYNTSIYMQKASEYTRDIILMIPNIQPEPPIYTILKEIIRNLLEITTGTKRLLSEHFPRLNIEPYMTYLVERKASRIDD